MYRFVLPEFWNWAPSVRSYTVNVVVVVVSGFSCVSYFVIYFLFFLGSPMSSVIFIRRFGSRGRESCKQLKAETKSLKSICFFFFGSFPFQNKQATCVCVCVYTLETGPGNQTLLLLLLFT
jgi:hypothetical protein